MTMGTEPASGPAAPASGAAPSNASAGVEKFLNPQSMLTPGICGVVTVGITNTLTQRFEMPEAWVGLAVSAVFGFLVVVNVGPLVQRVAYFAANTLIIFSMAFGVASAPHAISGSSTKATSFLFVGPASAQTRDEAGRLGGAAAALADECASATKTDAAPGLDRFCIDFLKSYRSNPEVKAMAPLQADPAPKSVNDSAASKMEDKAFFRPWLF